MNDLHLAILNAPNGTALFETNARLDKLTFSTNKHGYGVLSAFVRASSAQAWWLYDRPGLLHVVVTGLAGEVVYEGRLEDVALRPGGVQLTAYGYWRALSDVKYTALWSTTSYQGWFIGDARAIASNTPDRYEFNDNNRLYITPKKNETLGNTGLVKAGRWLTALPHLSARTFTRVEFTYRFLAPANWRALFQTFSVVYPIGSGTWTFLNTWLTLNGSGALQTASVGYTLTGNPSGLVFHLDFNAADAVYGSDTGTHYFEITNLRVTTSGSTIMADEIARHIVSSVNAVNPSQLQNIGSFIQSPGLDLRDEFYKDSNPADVLDRLASLGDTVSRQWEVGVWNDRVLHFRPRGSAGRSWFVDLPEHEIDRVLNTLHNSVYGVYQDASGRTLRTATNTDALSVLRYGVTRQRNITSQTTSATQANAERDALLADRRDIIPRIGIEIEALFDGNGIRYPKWMLRSGDTLTIRNLSPAASAVVDRIRTFVVSETVYDAVADRIQVTPENPLPKLDFMLARREAGI